MDVKDDAGRHVQVALTKTQHKFVKARLAGATITLSAIKAGLSPKTASAAGSRMAKQPAVMAALAGAQVDSKPRANKRTRLETFREAVATTPSPVSEDRPTYFEDPRDYLLFVMNNPLADDRLKSDAAKALLSAQVRKVAETGKKAARVEAAKTVGGGSRLSPAAPPPRLVAVNG
jgi:phage terminase small subunit